MSKFSLLVLALLAWPALSPAQSAPERHQAALAAADPDAAVPTPRYRSVLAHTPRGVVQDSANWQHANAQVGQYRRGHSDILRAEQTDAPRPAPARPHPESQP